MMSFMGWKLKRLRNSNKSVMNGRVHHMCVTLPIGAFSRFAVLIKRYLCRDAWDTAAEVCMEQLPILLSDPAAVFQVLLTWCPRGACVDGLLWFQISSR